MSIERILLVRHGQTDWNADGRWQGSEPVPLNAEGKSQAKALAKYLTGRPIGAIWSSDLRRAIETAETISRSFGITPQMDARWREFNLGIFQGHTRDEIQQHYPQEWAGFSNDYWDYPVPNGETRRHFLARLYDAWNDILRQDSASEVLIVTHGGAIKLLLTKLFEDNEVLRDVHIENTSLTTIGRDGDGWKLAELAIVPHLLRTLQSDSP